MRLDLRSRATHSSGVCRTSRARAFGLLGCGLLGWLTSDAQAQGFAGSYTSAPQRLEAKVSTWGEDCGPKPQSQTFDERVVVKVSEDGAHLLLRYPDRTLRTNGCWSPNVAIKLLSSTASNGVFRSDCRTASGDAKRELGRYTVTATPGKLELVEESEYDWQLKASHCEAKVRMTQTLTSGDKAQPVADAAVPAPQPLPAEPPAACVPGTPTRIRLRPAEARVAPGERVCFTVRAIDAAGCAQELRGGGLTFSLSKPSGAEATLNGACFKAAANAALAEGIFKVGVTSAGLRDTASVAVSALDLSDITARRGPSGSGSLGQTVPSNETVFESGVRAVASGSHGLLWLSLALAGLAAMLSAIAIVAVRLTRRRAAELTRMQSVRPSARARSEPAPSLSARPPAAPTPQPSPPAAAPAAGPQRICPRCRRGYAPFTVRCAIDDEPLLDYADFLKRSEQEAAPRSCPQCGEALAGDALFCGRCGQKV